MVARVGNGAFVDGYEVNIVDSSVDKINEYAVLTDISGKRVEESTRMVFNRRPKKLIEIYEFEGCPFCRKVREAVNILDLDILFYPCPKGGVKYRTFVKETGGKEQFPYMVDPNTGTAIYESDDIISYLWDSYGPEGSTVPKSLTLGFLTTLSCGLAMAPRLGKGSRKTPSTPPPKPIVYWGYEASPFCKVGREKLVELEIPHIQRCVARGSPKRQELFNAKGLFQVPYIEDPNTGESMFESVEIIKYLETTYGAASGGV